MITVISAIIVLGVLIFVHEFGHFIVAKWFDIKVLRFSLGFGPKLIGKTYGETEYCISAVPLGGYVKILGQDPEEEVEPEDEERAFSKKSVWIRMAVVVAGPLFNLLLAVFIFSVVYMFGVPQLTTRVGSVNKDFPAYQAGIQPGDRIVAVDGKKVANWEELSRAIRSSKGETIKLTIERKGKTITVVVPPKIRKTKNIFGEEKEVRMIGITASQEIVKQSVGPIKAIGMGFQRTWEIIYLTFVSIAKIIERVIPAKTIGGPIMIMQMAGQQAKEGVVNFVLFMALISINLGILNLLPIPVLDGGHLFFMFFEVIFGKPLSVRKMEIAQNIGLALLILLMVFAFYNDLSRIFNFKRFF